MDNLTQMVNQVSNIRPNVILKVFYMKSTFKLVDWINQIILPNVVGPHTISWRSEGYKKTDPSSE